MGIYGIVIENEKILLIKKAVGPYEGKLDLPGGSPEFGETPIETLKRELLEETGLEVEDANLYDASSVLVDWNKDSETTLKVHHTGIFFKVQSYKNDITKEVLVDEINDDSLGADFYEIDKLTKNMLSAITILELEKINIHLYQIS